MTGLVGLSTHHYDDDDDPSHDRNRDSGDASNLAIVGSWSGALYSAVSVGSSRILRIDRWNRRGDSRTALAIRVEFGAGGAEAGVFDATRRPKDSISAII